MSELFDLPDDVPGAPEAIEARKQTNKSTDTIHEYNQTKTQITNNKRRNKPEKPRTAEPEKPRETQNRTKAKHSNNVFIKRLSLSRSAGYHPLSLPPLRISDCQTISRALTMTRCLPRLVRPQTQSLHARKSLGTFFTSTWMRDLDATRPPLSNLE